MSRQLLSFLLLALTAQVVRAGTETREYSILVNGKDAGQSKITITESDDGKTYMKGSVAVKFQQNIIIPYSFTMEIQEWWLKDRLTNMVSTSTENSRKTEVVVKAEVDKLLVNVNGQIRAVSWESWINSFWKLADRRFHNKNVPLIEADTGKDMVGKLEYIATEKLSVGNHPEDCFHFKVTGIPVPTDLWYDRFHRLVRQEFTESGQRTIVQLMSRK